MDGTQLTLFEVMINLDKYLTFLASNILTDLFPKTPRSSIFMDFICSK